MIRRATLRDLPSLVRHRRGMFEDLGHKRSSADDRRYAAWLRARGFQRMTLHASKMGRRVYEKLGWKRTWEMTIDL